ncbi:MAG: hypothetical protein HFF41_06995 [Lawsonibacter sp.]|nr:hypothetical protein [Lawsonibacter sp.]
MGRANRDVGGYRGRRTITDILKFIAVALAVVVVLVLAGLYFAQRYIVYTDEGPKLELPPFLQMFRREEDPGGSASLPDVSVVVDSSTGEPEPDPVRLPEYALELPVEDVVSGAAAAKLEQAGADTLILTVKAPSGQLAWWSEEYTAQWSEVCGPEEVNAALKAWNEGEVYTVARVCCFQDDSAPYSRNKLALRRGDYNWRDALGLRWLSPAQEDAQAYLAGLCTELAYLGFDEILLEQWHFPIQGNVENITRGERYDPAQFTASLETFLGQVQTGIAPYGTRLSLRVERDTLAGTEQVSGVTAQLLEGYAARIWTAEDGLQPAPLDLLEQAGISGGRDRLVAIAAAPDEDRSGPQAVLLEP